MVPIHLEIESFILQAYWLHLQVVFVHLWGRKFHPHSVTPNGQCPFKPRHG